MNRVFVLDKNKSPLMPCLSARARELIDSGKARIYRMQPFTIILTEREGGDLQECEAKVDPGSKVSGFAIVIQGKRGKRLVWAANLEHRGNQIRDNLESRKACRRSRRHRKTRYRKARFDNRTRKQDWLAPSLQSRVDNIVHIQARLEKLIKITRIEIETVRFDTQKMQTPEISGVEYQQGELFGYEVREYLLEKWQRKCAYCGKSNTPLEIEHIVPKSAGGSNRISNLTLACHKCNTSKGNKPIESFLKNKTLLEKIKVQANSSLKDAAAVNSTRLAIFDTLKKFDIPLSMWSGGRTKFNRIKQNYRKDHWIDAACVGESGVKVYIPPTVFPLKIKAMGRGSRQMCRVDAYGFPRTSAKSARQVFGFRTGDLVKATVSSGKKKGTYTGRVAIRSTGNFNIKTEHSTIQGINHRFCSLLQRSDGYNYTNTKGGFLIPLKGDVSVALPIRKGF